MHAMVTVWISHGSPNCRTFRRPTTRCARAWVSWPSASKGRSPATHALVVFFLVGSCQSQRDLSYYVICIRYTSIYINIHHYTSIYINIHQYTSIYINIHYIIYIYVYTYILDWMSFSLTAFTFVRFNPRTCYGLRAPVNTIIILVVAVYNHVIFGEINHAWSVQRVQEYASNRPRNFHGYWIGQKCGCSQCNNGVCPNRSASFLFLSQPQNSREKCDVSCTVHVVFLILLRFLIDIESFLCKGSRPQTLVDHCW
jgi:hypothetical protein